MPDRRRRHHHHQRSTLSTYTPLILTLTVATAGLAAWIWTERRSSPDDPDDDRYYDKYYDGARRSAPPPPPPSDFGRGPASGVSTQPPPYESGVGRGGAAAAAAATADQGFLARVGGTVRNASPGLYDGAGRWVAAGVGAVSAGAAAVGLTTGGSRSKTGTDEGEGREGTGGRRGKQQRGTGTGERRREDGFSDHERWSEEVGGRRKGKEREGRGRSVAVVVSAERLAAAAAAASSQDQAGVEERATVLSHLPAAMERGGAAEVFVLIYAPGLGRETGLGGSYDQVDVQGPAAGKLDRAVFEALTLQARALTGDDGARVFPFETPTGYVHMLRHIAPQLVYVTDTPALAGSRGENLAQLRGWVGQTVVVVGDDGLGGLVDTETETEDEGRRGKRKEGWWETSDMVGLGKGVEVVDIRRIGEDWKRRVIG